MVVVGLVLASVGAANVAAKPKFNPNDNPCDNYKGGDTPNAGPGSHKGCPGSDAGLAPFLILAPLGLRGKSLAQYLD